MKIYKTIEEYKPVKNAVVTTGTFDGVHIGHQKIISQLKQIAQNENGETVLLTLFPHPRMVLYPDDTDLKMLNTIDEKIASLDKHGIEHLIIQPFTKKFSRLTSTQYVRDILANKIGTKKLVIGYNHHFGRNREGSFKQLVELAPLYDFTVVEIPKHDIYNIAVSSTRIRESLLKGDIKTARTFLGYDFSLSGKVVEGKKIGAAIGFPTANIEVKEKYKIIPAEGIYSAKILLKEQTYNGMLYIGKRPTLHGVSQTIEVNIFDFNQTIYNEPITVIFKEWIREDKKLNDLEELRLQLIKDKEAVLNSKLLNC